MIPALAVQQVEMASTKSARIVDDKLVLDLCKDIECGECALCMWLEAEARNIRNSQEAKCPGGYVLCFARGKPAIAHYVTDEDYEAAQNASVDLHNAFVQRYRKIRAIQKAIAAKQAEAEKPEKTAKSEKPAKIAKSDAEKADSKFSTS